MDGIQRAQVRGREIPGSVKERLVEAESSEEATGFADHVIVSRASQGARRISAQQGG